MKKIQNSKSKIQSGNSKLKIITWVITLILIFCLPVFAENVQKPTVAGAFYPDNPEKLKNMVDGFINNAQPEQVDGEIIALVLPHAGYQYSGWVAGYGAKIIKDKKYDTVIIVGLSHRAPFNGLAVLNKDFYRTPLGDVAVDKEISGKLIAYNKNISYYKLPFTIEHSAEVEIPFLQRALKDFKVVVILTGDFSYETCLLLRDALSSAVKSSNKNILLVASTDMSHFYPAQNARDIDARTMEEMERFDPETLFTKCLSWGDSERPCGTIGMIGVMMAAKNLGADKLTILKYATSGDVTFDKSQVVGYCSAAIYKKSKIQNPNFKINPKSKIQNSKPEEKEKKMEGLLNEKQKERLLEIARTTLENYIRKGQIPEFKEEDPLLNKELGAFVTLHKYGELRGCIGNMIGRGPLYLTVRDMAVAASTEDPRFPKVTQDELDVINIEISALSPMQRIDDPSKIIMGKHGVLVQSGFRSGVFLPQVATETGWDRETFMNNLCAHKAGLPSDAWKKGKCEIFVFTAEVFKEK